MVKLFKLSMTSLAAFGLLTTQALAQDKVETKLQLFRISEGQETLVAAPRLVAHVGTESRFELSSDASSPAMAFTTLISEASENSYNFDHHLILDGQDVTSSLLEHDDLSSQSTLIVKTTSGKYKLVIKTQKYLPEDHAGH